MFTVFHTLPIGLIKIFATDTAVTEIQFVDKEEKSVSNEILTDTIRQFDEYFAGKRTSFNLPILQVGTPFQQSVWKELMNIPYGEVTSYGAIAKKLGNEKAVRAVGAANGRNKIPILVPCHRVTGHDGKLVGFAYGITRKMYLLNHEKNNSKITTQLPLYV
jgi:methylated-DNA-[protein]-cysteine S-methyltransferase